MKLRSAAVFSLCGLFAVLAVGLTLLSANVYRGVAAAADCGFTQRTALSYLVNQLRRGDEAGGAVLTRFGGSDALSFRETADGCNYVTLIYCLDGQLRELYMEEGTGLAPEDGVAILPLRSLSLRAEDQLIRIAVTAEDGAVYTACAARRSAAQRGDAP